MSLILIDANNRCWKPWFLYVTLAVVTLHLDRYMLMMGVMAYSPTDTDGAHTPGGALDGLVDDVEMAHTLGWVPWMVEPLLLMVMVVEPMLAL